MIGMWYYGQRHGEEPRHEDAWKLGHLEQVISQSFLLVIIFPNVDILLENEVSGTLMSK